MSGFINRSVDWLARLIAGSPGARGQIRPGTEIALDGATAAAAAEAMWCDLACLGAGFPASASARAWADHPSWRNAHGPKPRSIEAGSAQGTVAAAIGAASAGLRSVAFVSGDDLAGIEGALQSAAGSHLPMVLHVAARTRQAHGLSPGGGHESWHSASDTGWAQLFAINAQEIADLALVARIAAERSLTPVMVGCDGQETALAVQDVRLPDAAVVRSLLASSDRRTEPASEAQRMLFGERRRVVPAWLDPDEPVMLGAAEPPALAMAGRLGAGDFFAIDAGPAIAGAMKAVSDLTGRPLSPVLEHKTRDAELVIVAIGSAVETAIYAADRIRETMPVRAGVLGMRQTRPWPEGEIVEVLRRASSIVMLERTGTPMAGRGPLTREVLCSLARLAVTPTLAGAWHGVGGDACRVGEIIEVCRAVFTGKTGPHLLGVGIEPEGAVSPKQRVVIDAVRRAYPELTERTHRAGAHQPAKGASTFAVLRRPGAADEPAPALIAGVLHAMVGGRMRSRPWLAAARRGVFAVDRIAMGPGALTPTREAGEIAALVSDRTGGEACPLGAVIDGGRLLVPIDADGSPPVGVGRSVFERASARGISMLGVPVPPAKAYEKPEPAWRRHEAMAGAMARAVAGDGADADRAHKARRKLLADPESEESRARLAAFDAGFAGVAPLGVGSFPPEDASESEPDGAGHIFGGLPVNDPAGYWSRVGESLSSGGKSVGLDPFASAGVTPAGSCARRHVMPGDGGLLEFDPVAYDGSAGLWADCPDGSVRAVALGLESILRAGMALCEASALSPVVGNIAKLAHKSALDEPPVSVRSACEGAFRAVIGKMDAGRRGAIESAFAALMEAIGELPIVRIAALFDTLERDKPGSGAFLVIGIDPDRCTHAGAAAGESLGRGLRIISRDAAGVARARRLWSVFESLPDTPGAVVEHARTQPAIGPMAAVMLVRSCAGALRSGDDAEPGSGARLALRQVLAVCESEVQPRVAAMVGEITSLRERLGEKIRVALASAVPDADLEALSAGLDALGREDVELTDLAGRIGEATESQRLDAATLRLWVDAARDLDGLAWRLTTGPTGEGRSRMSLVLSQGPGTAWASWAPFNAFGAPVLVDGSSWSPEMALGLVEGMRSRFVRGVRAVRWAREVLERPGEAGRASERITALGWEDLGAEERAACPPVILVGDDASLARGALGSLLRLLESGAGVKAVLLTSAGPESGWGVDSFGPFPGGSGADIGLMAMVGRRALVVQGSIAARDHLALGVQAALRHDGPALVAVHAPSPERHGFEVGRTLEQARLAVASRVWPLVRFEPVLGVFGACLDLGGNPSVEKELAGPTPLDWAVTEGRFKGAWGGSSGALRPSGSAVDPGGRFVRVTDPLDRSEWVASGAMAAFAEERVRVWRMLQELSGVVTPFTERVRDEASASVEAAHSREVETLRKLHEQSMGELRSGFEREAVARMRDGFLAMAGYGGGEVEHGSGERVGSDGLEARPPEGGEGG